VILKKQKSIATEVAPTDVRSARYSRLLRFTAR
jgi:hypothetical protein